MKRLYFKKWVQNLLLITEFFVIMALLGVIDNIDTPISTILLLFIPHVVICSLLAIYGRFEDKEDEE